MGKKTLPRLLLWLPSNAHNIAYTLFFLMKSAVEPCDVILWLRADSAALGPSGVRRH